MLHQICAMLEEVLALSFLEEDHDHILSEEAMASLSPKYPHQPQSSCVAKDPFLEEEGVDLFHYLISTLHDLQVNYKIHLLFVMQKQEDTRKHEPLDCFVNSAERVAGSTYGGNAWHFDFSDSKNSLVYLIRPFVSFMTSGGFSCDQKSCC